MKQLFNDSCTVGLTCHRPLNPAARRGPASSPADSILGLVTKLKPLVGDPVRRSRRAGSRPPPIMRRDWLADGKQLALKHV